MDSEGLKVMIQSFDPDAMASLIHGCTVSGYFARGKEIHGLLIKYSFFPSTIIVNSLMDMHAKNEQVDHASEALEHLTPSSMARAEVISSQIPYQSCAQSRLVPNLHTFNRAKYSTAIQSIRPQQ